MSAASFRGRGMAPRGRKIRGMPGVVMGSRNPQPNFNQPRRGDGHVHPPSEFWLEHPPAVPWQQMNGHPGSQAQQFSGFDPHRYRGRPQFCPGIGARGRSKRIRGDGRPRLGILPASGFPRQESEPVRFAPLGSEEERQQKIAETADKLKQKLSSLTTEEPINFWEDDLSGVSFSQDEEQVVANKGIPELRHDPPELNLTVNDFKDIGRVDPDCSLNSTEGVELGDANISTSEVQGAEEEEDENSENWHQSEDVNHLEFSDEINSPLNTSLDLMSDETPGETTDGLNSSEIDSMGGQVDQRISDRPDQHHGQNRKVLPAKLTEEQMSSVIGRAAAKALEKKTSSEAKPELTKSLEKLREVIKVDRELENEGKSVFQPNAGPRLQPDVRLDFHPGIPRPGYPRFQGFQGHGVAPHDMRNRYRGPFRPENPMEMQPGFAPEFQRRFDREFEPDTRNFNLPQRNIDPRIMRNEFGARNQDLQHGFDPWEPPPPRFNVNNRQDHPNNQHWFNRNELPQKYGPNELQPPPAFDPRGPPRLRFMNQDQEMPVYGEFSQVMPIGFHPQVPHMHMGHRSGYFNPAMPPPNTAPCIIHKFQPPVPHPAMENQPTLQPPPLPMGALDIQSHILSRPPPSPPATNEPRSFLSDQNPTPNMNEELEDMQEALEFAKKIMNMTEEEEEREKEKVKEVEDDDADQTFDMPIFPDLPPIPSTEPSHLAERTTAVVETVTDSNKDAEVAVTRDILIPEFAPPAAIPNETIKKIAPNLKQKEQMQEELVDDQSRPKVTFNLNSRSKMIAQPNEWKQQNEVVAPPRERISRDKDKLAKSQAEDKTSDVSKLRESKNSRKNKIQLEDKQGDILLKQKENRAENAVEIATKISGDIKARASSSKTSALSKTSTPVAATVDSNWKDKVINQFLKMSKNDICNMVNSSGLRKFDIAMKHLVKERKNSLSHERRCSADDAVKGTSSYDMSREEFMRQLSAMLDPSATVDLKNLPSKFIQHLSEVLKLDVQSHLNETADLVQEENVQAVQEDYNLPDSTLQIENLPHSSYITDETFGVRVKNEIATDQDVGNFFNDKDNSLPNTDAIDNIFSQGIARAKQGQKTVPVTETQTVTKELENKSKDIEGEFISHGLIRARCTKTLMSAEHAADLNNALSASFVKETVEEEKKEEEEKEEGEETPLESIDNDTVVHASEEVEEQEEEEAWGKKEREDPDMFRNLTKEEWEARSGRPGDYPPVEKEPVIHSITPSSRETSLSAISHSPKFIEKGLKGQTFIRNLSPPALSPLREINLNLNIAVNETAVDKWPKTTEDQGLAESDSDDSSSSASSNQDQPNPPKVTKLLKVIKQREKIAKDINIGETIRHKVAAEIERSRGKEDKRGQEVVRKSRKREKSKSKRRKERRVKKKTKRKRRTGSEVEEDTVAPNIAENIDFTETVIKQEELIIEADSVPFIETSSNLAATPETQVEGNSHSTVENIEKTRSEILYQENSEPLEKSESVFNPGEIHVAQANVTSLTLEELKAESLSQDVYQSEMEGSLSTDNSLGKFESREIGSSSELQLSKSGAKKIDIEAYKARKLQRNNERRDKSREIETSVQSSSRETQETAKEISVDEISRDLKNKKGDKDPSDDQFESGSEKKDVLDEKESSPPIEKKEKGTKVKSKKKKEKRQSKDKSTKEIKKNRKTNSDEKDDKKRTKVRSRDRERSTSREESRKSSKERSRHSQEKRHHSARSLSEDKSAHQNNNVVESRDRKSSTDREICDSPKEDKNKKNLIEEEEERPGDEEIKLGEQSPGIISQNKEEQKVDLPNDDLSKETDDVEETCKEITNLVETDEVSSENVETITTEQNVSEQSGEVISNDVETQDCNDIPLSENPNLPSEREEPAEELGSEIVPDPEDGICVENAEKDAAVAESSSEQENCMKDFAATEEEEKEIPKLDDLKEPENETMDEVHLTEAESTEKSTSQEGEEILEEVAIESEIKEPSQNDIKSILNDLIEKAISQLDLLSGKNEAKETAERAETTEETEAEPILGIMTTENERGFREFIEYNSSLEINAPHTPETPLKGFSEESIKSSILGKRRLAESVFEITEDYMVNKRSKDFDNIVLGMITEGANISNDHQEPNTAQEFQEVIPESRIFDVQIPDGLNNHVSPEESGLKADDHHADQVSARCVTPSGDTLSLGSSIDFDNSEFIALSEISSDEYFSQEEDRRPETRGAMMDYEKLIEEAKSNSEEITGEKEIGSEIFSAIVNTELTRVETSKSTKDLESEATHSKLQIDDENLDKNFNQSPGKESDLCLRDDNEENPAAIVLGESNVKTTEKISEETKNLGKLVGSEVAQDTPSCKLISKKSSTPEDDSGKKKNSDSKKSSKSEEIKSAKSLPKEENSTSKNLHRVKHRHRMKHKKEKKCRIGEKQIKEAVKVGELVNVVKKQQTKEGVMARMIEIDLEIQKLMSEKMKLYQMLESGELPTEQLGASKEEPEPLAQTSNTSKREPDHHSSKIETSAKQKSSSSHQKSSKTTAVCTSEDDAGHRHSGNQKDASKKSKKTHKQERPTTRQDNAVQNEPKKPPAESKSSISKKKHTEDKTATKKDGHSRSGSSNSNKRRDEETVSSRKDEHGKKNVTLAKENLDEDCHKKGSKKVDHHHATPRKKTSRTPDSKEDLLRWMKREEQLFGMTEKVDVQSESVNDNTEKHPPQIYSDESSQVSITLDNKVPRKGPKGLALLEETYKRERALSRKRRAVLCKRKKERLKSLQRSEIALSPSEEEMPLDLLYSKKFQRKKETINNSKSKRTTNSEVLEHILEAINAVAENRIEEYQRPKKSKAEIQEMADKVASKSNNKPANDNLTNSATDEPFRVLWPFEDVQGGKNLAENLSEDDYHRGLDEFGKAKSSLAIQESDNKFPIDQIVEISRENISAGNIYGGELESDIVRGEEESGNISCPRWSEEDILRSNTSENNTFDYLNDIAQFEDPDSAFIPQDQTSHSLSISRNLDIEKGLDVLDSMLETVGGDLEGISPKDIHSSFVKRGKRKRIVSGESDNSSKKRNPITRTEMMNCTVRLVDCKYTYLKNCWNSGTAQRFTIFPADPPPQQNATSLKIQNSTESHPRTPKSKSPVLPQAISEEPSDWSLKDDQLIDCDENLPALNNEQFLIPGSDLALNHMEGSFPYDDDDLEIMKLHPSSHGEDIEALTGEDDWQLLGKSQTDDHLTGLKSDLQTTIALDVETAVEISPEEEITELGLPTNSFSEIIEAQDPERDDEILESETGSKCTDDIQVINPPKNQETSEIQEVELPRIQYSVHKGPILDVKVFGDSILAASEDGVIYRYSQTCNGILNTYEGHKSAVTCIHVLQGPVSSKDCLFSSSLDGSLRCFDIMTSHQVRGAADVGSPVQCMDQSWGVIFLGTKSGYVFRFHIKSHAFKGDEIKFSEESVLALKATTEGPRRVLIVASRSQPITIRDAQSGLFLRTVSGHKSHTVYSLMMDSNLVYCGTSSTAIPVFDFINGSQVKLYNAGPGIVCMRMYKWLLFAGCYDGNIYVFDTKEQRLVCSIPGPGNMLLSMDIVQNKIVAGSKDRRLHMWQMPDQVITLLAGRT